MSLNKDLQCESAEVDLNVTDAVIHPVHRLCFNISAQHVIKSFFNVCSLVTFTFITTSFDNSGLAFSYYNVGHIFLPARTCNDFFSAVIQDVCLIISEKSSSK